jgi:hypothetical protein
MELFGSPQSIVTLALAAAGCLVAGGCLSRQRERWINRRRTDARAERRKGLPAPAPGPRVMVVGVLKVEGLCTSRFEDAVPVAVTTFQQPRGSERETRTVTWCNRARRVWVDVGDDRVTIEGPIRVDIGSEEHYPGCPLSELRGRILQRIFASQIVPTSADDEVPSNGVFRSIRPDDQVVVVGRIERISQTESEHHWRLRPDDSGAVTLCYRRRPAVRGALFKMTDWAAA